MKIFKSIVCLAFFLSISSSWASTTKTYQFDGFAIWSKQTYVGSTHVCIYEILNEKCITNVDWQLYGTGWDPYNWVLITGSSGGDLLSDDPHQPVLVWLANIDKIGGCPYAQATAYIQCADTSPSPAEEKAKPEQKKKTSYCEGDKDNDGTPNCKDDCEENPKIQHLEDQDFDGDCVHSSDDNCPNVSNADQKDTDGGGKGDVCDDDADNDGLPNDWDKSPLLQDADGDGLSDTEELILPFLYPRTVSAWPIFFMSDPMKADTDGDGLPDGDEVKKHKTNPAKADSDGDGVNDGAEVAAKTNPNTNDTDGDKLSDKDELNLYKTDPTKKDTDGDGLSDFDELKKYGTYPTEKDHDKDGLSDGDEILKYGTSANSKDTDGDGLSDGEEILNAKSDPKKKDTDGDGLADDEWNLYKTSPLKKDTDGDGLSDKEEIGTYFTDPLVFDMDGDGAGDGDEIKKLKTDPKKADQTLAQKTANQAPRAPERGGKVTASPVAMPTASRTGVPSSAIPRKSESKPSSPDADSDGLSDANEAIWKTDPKKPDTDGDGLNDWQEAAQYKTSPLLIDTDDDNLNDWEELNVYKTDPLKKDSNGNGIDDYHDLSLQQQVASDLDNDGAPDKFDNCPKIANAKQTDTDKDKQGDACDAAPFGPDTDGDGAYDITDNCPKVAGSQVDADFDGVGSVCDNCPKVKNPDQQDSDKDGIGDACDTTTYGSDSDGDGVGDSKDNCSKVKNANQNDSDGDGYGDVCDPTPTKDSWITYCENGKGQKVGQFKQCPTYTSDFDKDGISDLSDKDIDGDGVINDAKYSEWASYKSTHGDYCPFLATPKSEAKIDTDGDFVGDACDNCPTVKNGELLQWVEGDPSSGKKHTVMLSNLAIFYQADSDGDGIGDACDK